MFVFVNNHIKSWKKINICVSLSPSLIWKPKTNIEILKSPNASFPINYQWLHLAGWAAEGSNVRPGYFRAPSSEPWAQAVWNLSMCCALPYLEAAAAQQLFLPSIPALMQYIWLWHYTRIPLQSRWKETGWWKEMWTEQVCSISWTSLLVLHKGITSVGWRHVLVMERSPLQRKWVH